MSPAIQPCNRRWEKKTSKNSTQSGSVSSASKSASSASPPNHLPLCLRLSPSWSLAPSPTTKSTTPPNPNAPKPTSSSSSPLPGPAASSTPSSGSAGGVPPPPSTSSTPSLASTSRPDYLELLSLCLSDLSARQLGLIDELQRSTVREERRITEKEAKQQETVADAEMVELSHVAAEEEEEGRVGLALRGKEEGFEKVLRSADRLRMETLKGVVGILSLMQAVHFLIAAGELHLSLHEWGRDKDERDAVQCNA